MITDLTLFTCNYNNEDLTLHMLTSFYIQLGYYIPNIILDNSDITPLSENITKNCKVIDNQNYKITKNYGNISKNHCAAIDYVIKNLVTTKYVLLCDNDILFKPEIKLLLNLRHYYDCIGEINFDWCKPERLYPYCCLIDVEKFKNEKLNYFDDKRCIITLDKGIFYDVINNGKKVNIENRYLYDTGASFYEDIKNKWNILNIDLSKFIVHYKNGSQLDDRNNLINKYDMDFGYKTINEFFTKNKKYFTYA